MGELGRQLDLFAGTIGPLRDRVELIGDDLAALRERLAPADADLHARQRVLDRRMALADEMATNGRTAGRTAAPTTFAEVTAPLQMVTRAIHSSDELAIEVLRQQDSVQAQAQSLRLLQASLRQAAYQIATQERAARERLAAAMGSAHVLADAGADTRSRQTAAGVVAEARAQLHALQVAGVELRQVESEVLRASVSLEDRQGELRARLGRSRRTIQALYEDMFAAESLVGARYQLWQGPVEGSAPVIEGILQVCPVDLPHAYSDDWGAPRWAGGFHLHQGNDIFALPDTPIRAPFDGTAVITENALGGNAVTVYGRDGYVYNAHLSGYGTLGPVTAGTIIGYVGNTGDAVNSPPHDHFEWHPGNGPAVDPFPYLNAVC